MAYRIEKEPSGQKALVIDGWEYGIAPSPYKGIGNIQNANISIEEGEVMCSFARTSNLQTTINGGTFSALSASTLTYSGATALTKGAAVTISASTITNLSTTTYWVVSVSGTTIELSATYNGASLSTLGVTGTATFSTFSMGIPIGKALERYFSSGTERFRYYQLTDDGRVWCYDTGLVASGYANWFLINSTSVGSSSLAGIGVLNGYLFVLSGRTINITPTVKLSSDMTSFISGGLLNSNVPHYTFTGHQGRMYWTDGNFIGSLFPNSALLTGTPNIQSYCSYTASTVTGTASLIGGSLPTVGDTTTRIPVVLFTAAGGTIPTAITANTVYYLEPLTLATDPFTFKIYAGYTVSSIASITPQMGGQNYVAGDTITIGGGGFTTAAVITVSTVDTSGTILTATVSTAGSYQIKPSNPVSQSGTSGNGSGAKFTLNWDTPAAKDIATGSAGTQYFNTFYPIGTSGAGKGEETFVWSAERLNLPAFEVATTIGELGNLAIIGTRGNVVYPWNQVDVLPGDLIPIPENNVASFLTVNNMAYIFAGNKGNIYLTNGSTASKVFSVPDYCAGIAGTPATYIDPYFTWGGNMYLRGRVYFSILDQNSGHTTGNCGGIWSFVPSQNFFYGQDTGLGLRMEAQSSYGTYNGYCPILIPNENQAAIGPQYFSGWISSYSASTGGIDTSSSTPSVAGVALIETELIPVGTMLDKQTFSQIEYKLSAPLVSGESVSIKYRKNSTDAFTSLGTAITEGDTALSGYFQANFEKSQWLQLQTTLTPIASASGSFVRLKEIRVR